MADASTAPISRREQGRTALFFAKVGDRQLLETIEFYSEDIHALKRMGFDVRIETSFHAAMSGPAPDLLYCWWPATALPVIMFWRLRGVPTATTGATDFTMKTNRTLKMALRRINLLVAARCSSSNLLVSEFEASQFKPVGRTKCTVVPHGIDTDYFRPGSGGFSQDACTISQLYPLNIRRKGVDMAISATPLIRATIPKYRLHVIGKIHPTAEPVLAELLREVESGSVILHGEVSRAEKLAILQSSALYLQPSEYEGFGVAAAEALAVGLPVVHSGLGALTEVIGSGGVVSDRDRASIAAATIRLLTNPEELRILSAIARERSLELSTNVRQQRFSRAIEKILQPTLPAPA